MTAVTHEANHLLTVAELEAKYRQLEKRVKSHEREARNYELTAEGPGDFDSFLSRDECYDLAEAHRRWAGEDEDAMTDIWLRLEELGA